MNAHQWLLVAYGTGAVVTLAWLLARMADRETRAKVSAKFEDAWLTPSAGNVLAAFALISLLWPVILVLDLVLPSKKDGQV